MQKFSRLTFFRGIYLTEIFYSHLTRKNFSGRFFFQGIYQTEILCMIIILLQITFVSIARCVVLLFFSAMLYEVNESLHHKGFPLYLDRICFYLQSYIHHPYSVNIQSIHATTFTGYIGDSRIKTTLYILHLTINTYTLHITTPSIWDTYDQSVEWMVHHTDISKIA